MKVLFIGLGSIGWHHLRLLKQIVPCEMWSYRSGCGKENIEIKDVSEIHFVDDLDKAIKVRPDFAIISNPTAFHVRTALPLAEAGIPFLLEKPVSNSMDHLDELQAMVERKKVPVIVGFQLRQHPAYQKAIELIQSQTIGRIISLHGYVGQYLPSWRPGVDYRQIYSAEEDLGGGVILDLCHEIDIALSMMGPVKRISCVVGHYSDLEINTEDCAEIILEHEQRKISHIHLNYIEPGYQWWTRVMGTHGSIFWDYGNGFMELVSGDGSRQRWDYSKEVDRDSLFSSQLSSWLKVLRGGQMMGVTLREGIEVTRVAVVAKRAAKEGRAIAL